MRPRRSRRRSRRRAGHRHARAGEARVHRTRDGVHAADDAAGDADMARVASRSALSTFYRDMFHERSTPRRQSRARVSRSDENVEHASNEQISEMREKPDPATPSPPHSRCRARAGGVTRPVGPVGRDGRLAPHRYGAPALARAPSRVPRALQRAKNGQRATEAREVASDAPIENRAGAAFAHGDAGAARHVRDDRRRRYVGARAEPCARSNRANPPRTRRGPRGRAPHTSIIRSKTSAAAREEPFRGFRHCTRFHVDSGVS